MIRLNTTRSESDEHRMDTSVVMLGFLGGVGLFSAWLVVLLRGERYRHDAYAEKIRDTELSNRRATMTARAESTAPADPPPIVRPGSFCRVPGTVGRSSRGTLLVCSSVPQARPRWREARRLSRAS
jgi:hypothetical protein